GGKNGKTLNLVESPDMVVIRTEGNKELENVKLSREGRELIDQMTEVVAFPEAGVTVQRITPFEGELESSKSTIAQRDETRVTLNQEDNIKFAGRVLQDAESGEVMLYTENFFVKFKDDISEKDCLAIIEKYQLKIKNKLPFAANSWFVEAVAGTGLKVFEIAEKLLKEKEVEFCHPELIQERRYKGIHPLQWHLAKTTIGGKTVDAHVNIEKAWQRTRGKGVTIAVIDDGVEIDHPEFAGRIVHPFDATENNNNPRPKSKDDNHGTSCAGMACAAGLNDGASGVAPEAQLMPSRLRSGLGSMAEANAFAWAADKGADVISCSWGPTDGEWWNPGDAVHNRLTMLPDSTRLAMDYALTKGRGGKGCVILFAAGNGNEDTKNDGYASYPGVIAVAACNDTGRRSVYSDFGEAVWVSFPSGDFGYKPFQHPAPISQGLRTTDRLSKEGYDPSDYTNTFGGTSGACPGAAGTVALILAINPNLTQPQVKDLLRTSCQRIDTAGGEYDAQGHSIWYGYGRVDAGLAVENALKAAQQPASPVVIVGTAKFSTKGEQALLPDGTLTGNFTPAKKLLGLKLNIKPALKGLQIKYKVNVPNLGILENKVEGEYVGAATGLQRVIGFSVAVTGTEAKNYEVEYSARLQGVATLASAKNGAWVGTDKKTGKTIQALSVRLKKKQA
ncbi:MAG TPA: S8 family serine peptidase, partial [Saprospiraceae bacterium]|nr:S8 family serine peptidase [Saprospiraceae bacterium]